MARALPIEWGRSTTLAPRKPATSEKHATQTFRNSHRKVSTVSASRLKTTETAEAKVPLKSTDEAVAKAKERIRQRELATERIKVSEQRRKLSSERVASERERKIG